MIPSSSLPSHNFLDHRNARAQQDSDADGRGEEASIESVLDSSTSLSSIGECGRPLPARGSTSGIDFKRTAPALGESLRFFFSVAGLGVWRDPPRPRSLSRRGRRCHRLRGPRLRGRMGGRDGDPRAGGLRPGVAACSLPGGWGFNVQGPRCGVDWPVCEVAQADTSELAQGERMARGLLGGAGCVVHCALSASPRQPFGFQVP